jgi:hypothetical protein
MKLNARALKVSAVLDPLGLRDPGSASRVVLEIAVNGKTYTADVSSKSVRKARVTIAENGADDVALLVQGKLEGASIVEAGLVAQLRNAPKGPQNATPATQTSGART